MLDSVLTLIEEAEEEEVCQRLVLLLDNGFDVSSADSFGTTPLHSACRCHRSQVAELLISKGANLFDSDRDGVNAMYLAANGGYSDIVELLLRSGFDSSVALNTRCIEGCTAFYAACHQSHLEVAGLLFRSGADPNIADDEGNTPLMSAIVGGREEVVEFLVGIRVDASLANLSSVTAVDMAYLTGRKSLIHLLVGCSGGKPLPKSQYQVCLNKICSNANHLEECEGCKSVFYCSPHCKRSDLDCHRRHCPRLP